MKANKMQRRADEHRCPSRSLLDLQSEYRVCIANMIRTTQTRHSASLARFRCAPHKSVEICAWLITARYYLRTAQNSILSSYFSIGSELIYVLLCPCFPNQSCLKASLVCIMRSVLQPNSYGIPRSMPHSLACSWMFWFFMYCRNSNLSVMSLDASITGKAESD
jgi:hypothetical protein